MKILAIVGPSGSGKTTLIERLVAELKGRGLSVAVIKHGSRGFNIDHPGKDSWRFREAGADGVGLVSPEETIIIQRKSGEVDDLELATSHFSEMDIVLIEGRRAVRNIPKLELLRKGVAERVTTPPEELAAVVSDFEIELERPVFQFPEMKEIADLVEREAWEPQMAGGAVIRRSREDE
jgi:molybdopterin-guanine dinucleotide biosynthesis protein MobB